MSAIYKPSRLGVAMRTEVASGNGGYGGLTTVAAHVLFDFVDPRRLLTDQALWPLVAEQMPQGAIFDKCNLKPKGELIVAGDALAPGDRPISGCRVAARLGPVEKRLAVFGDQIWRRTDRGIELLEAVPFDRMPIDETRAFGGPDFKPNPRGRGHNARRIVDAGYDAPLPNVESANRLIRSIDDTPVPVHFGPLPPDDARRLLYAGTYDQHWIDKVSPLKPEDFNPLFYCDAPPDQRVDGHFKGNETFVVSGMSRGDGTTGGQLPDLRVRAFCHKPRDDSFHELRMVCDTVTLFPNVTKAVVTYHGVIRGDDRFGEDIGAILLAAEHAEDTPRPQGYYLDIYRLRSDPEQAHKHALSDFQLMPDVDPAVVSTRRQQKLEKARQDRVTFLENANWLARREVEASGVSPDIVPPVSLESVDDLPLVAMPRSEEIESGDVDIAEIIDDVETLRVALMEKADREMARAELQRRAIVASSPPGLLTDHMRQPIVDDEHMARFPDLALDEDVASALSDLDASLDVLADPGASLDRERAGAGFEEGWAEIDKAFAALEDSQAESPDKIEEQFRLACARALGLPEGSMFAQVRDTFDDLSFDVPGGAGSPQDPEIAEALESVATRPTTPHGNDAPDLDAVFDAVPFDAEDAEVRDRVAASGEALRKIAPQMVGDDPQDDPIAGLVARTNALLPQPDPDDAALTATERVERMKADYGAQLDSAEAEIESAIVVARQSSPVPIYPVDPLSAPVAERLGAFVAGKLSEGHDFRGADLAGAVLRGIDFSGLDLRDTLFEKADLTDARFAGARLQGAVLAGAMLDGADLSGSDLTGANLSKAWLRGARLDRCTLSKCTIIDSDFSGASARNIGMSRSVLIDCILDQCDFGESEIEDLQLLQGRADGIRMDGVRLARGSVIALSMKRASFANGAFERVAFADVDAPGSVFAGATFRSVSFMGKCDLTGSRYDRIAADESSWLTAKLDESCFVRARVHGCLFNDCTMTASDLRVASLRETQFGKSVMIDSDLFAANLFAASLMQADLRRASLRGANLYGANLLETKLGSCDLTGANLAMTLLEQATHA